MRKKDRDLGNDTNKKLRPKWRVFVDEYFSNGFNATKAYIKAYSIKNGTRGAQAAASRLLRNVIIRGEIYKRLEAESCTDDFVIANLMRIALHNDSYRIKAAVTALMTLARVRGMLAQTKKPVFSAENPAIFLSPYTKEEMESFHLLRKETGRILE